MGGDMVALGTSRSAVLPLAGQTEVVGGLSANVVIAEMKIEKLCVWSGEGAV